MEIKYIKSTARLLDWFCVNKRDLDLFKEVLWVSVGQGVAELWSVKLEVKKNSADQPGSNPLRPRLADRQKIFRPPTLRACSSSASWSKETQSTSIKRSKPLLLTQSLFKSTFNIFYPHSKWPHFNSIYKVRVTVLFLAIVYRVLSTAVHHNGAWKDFSLSWKSKL